MSKDDRLSPATSLEGTLHQEEARESARGGLLRKKKLRGKVDDEGREKLNDGKPRENSATRSCVFTFEDNREKYRNPSFNRIKYSRISLSSSFVAKKRKEMISNKRLCDSVIEFRREIKCISRKEKSSQRRIEAPAFRTTRSTIIYRDP